MSYRVLLLYAFFAVGDTAPSKQSEQTRIFGIIPNYRTYPSLLDC
jgi:hypothetical protein